MKLQHLTSKPIVEALNINDFAPKKHPKELADSVEIFNTFLREEIGYLDKVNAVKYLGYSKSNDYVFGALSEDNQGDEKYLVTKFYAFFGSDAKLTGDWGGMPLTSSNDLDEADDEYEKMEL